MNIIEGKQVKPPRVVIYGGEGIGKTTFASQAKTPIIIQTEDGADNLDVAKFPLAKTEQDILDAIKYLATKEHKYKTVIVDTWDSLEGMLIKELVDNNKGNSLNTIAGGYGVGKGMLLGKTKNILEGLHFLREQKGMTVIILVHEKVFNIKNPEKGEYDKTTLNCINDVSSQLVSWADVVGFATTKMVIDTDTGLAKQINNGERILYLNGTASHVGKNRYNMPNSVKLDWATFITELVK